MASRPIVTVHDLEGKKVRSFDGYHGGAPPIQQFYNNLPFEVEFNPQECRS